MMTLQFCSFDNVFTLGSAYTLLLTVLSYLLPVAGESDDMLAIK